MEEQLSTHTDDLENIKDYLADTIEQIKNENKDQKEPEIEEGSNNLIIINIILFIIYFPTIFYGFFCINPLTAVVILIMGKVTKVYTSPGLKWYWPIGVERKYVSLSINTFEVKDLQIPDVNGSPMNVSTVITYQIVDPKLSLFAVDDLNQFLIDQAQDVTKRIVSKFPYNSSDPEQPSLLNDTIIIGQLLKYLLQIKTKIAGVKILRMELMEFSYDKTMTQNLLKVQMAKAKVEARQMIADASALIVKDAIDRLEKEDIQLNDKNRQKLKRSLMVMNCGEIRTPKFVIKM